MKVRIRYLMFVQVLILFCLADILLGQATIYYVKAPSAPAVWNDTRNWNPQRLPTANDIVEVGNGHTVTLSGISPTVKALTIRAQATLIIDDPNTALSIMDAPDDGLRLELRGHLDVQAGTVIITDQQGRGIYLENNSTIINSGVMQVQSFGEDGFYFTGNASITNNGFLSITEIDASNALFGLSAQEGTFINNAQFLIFKCVQSVDTDLLEIASGVDFQDFGETAVTMLDCN